MMKLQIPAKFSMLNEKASTSYGVACCRLNKKCEQNTMEILLVQKKYTYEYNMFILGKFINKPLTEVQFYVKLFSHMTFDEKLEIASLDFSRMWYRMWLSNEKKKGYNALEIKFKNVYLNDDGERLLSLLSMAGSSELFWEIPKGKKKAKSESDLNCAIREFEEETRIIKRCYKVFPNNKKSYSFVDYNVTYTNTYYIGYTKHIIKPKIHFTTKTQISEIKNIRWMNIEEIRAIDKKKQLEKFIQPIFKFIKNRIRDNTL